MKHFMLPKGAAAVFREAQTPPPPAYDSPPTKGKPSSKKQGRCKENTPPPDPNSMGSDRKASPAAGAASASAPAKARCPLPPRPPSSNPLKRKLSMETIAENALAGASDSGVKVLVRMRPHKNDEEEGDMIVENVSNDAVTINGQTFTFDAVADPEASQLDIFELVGAPLVENCLAGFNSSIFAYGQTGSGKTYTMWGPTQALLEDKLSNQQGLTPRILECLFTRINEEQIKHADKQLKYQCRCSFLEIYNEQITDLLDPSQRNLQIREDVKTGVYVENLTEEIVCTMKDVNQLLLRGLSNRRTGATSINAESSRSHSVFTCIIESRCKSMADGMSSFKTSRINLVDLAGSERQKLTGAAGDRLKEAGNINRSLSQLGNLIKILAEISQTGKQRHIPYRDSKLTFLLQESLGGNAKLAMVCAISPAPSCKSETFSTLRFAQHAKAIKNKAVVNEVMREDVKFLREVIRQLKDELLRMKENGNNPSDSKHYLTGKDVRRSLHLLNLSLHHPMTLPHADDDSDEEMEIDEEAVERLCHQVGLRSSSCGDMEGVSEQPDVENLGDPIVETSDGTSSKHLFEGEKSDSLDVKMDDGEAPAVSLNSSTDCLTPSGLNVTVSETSPLKSPTPSVSPRVTNTSRKSLRTSSMLTASQKNLENDSFIEQAGLRISSPKSLNKSSSHHLPTQRSSSYLVPTEHLAASLQRGLEIMERKSSALRRSSFRFSYKPAESKSIIPVIKVDTGVQVSLEDNPMVVEAPMDYLCSNCRTRTQTDVKDVDGGNLQIVPVGGSESSEKSKKQVPKAVEKVLTGAFRREMALEEFCGKQAAEIMQLNRLVQQFKHERECNAIIAQTREDKILRLESLMDGVMPTEEFMGEEFASLNHEYKLLKEKYENHPEVLQSKIELKRLQDELEQYQNFFNNGEREVLLEEIQDLRSQLQYYMDASTSLGTKRSPPLLLDYPCGPSPAPSLSTVPESIEESAKEKFEQERKRWTEAESKWISLTEELRMELEASRSQAEKWRQEYETEKKCTEDLEEAMRWAMEGQARTLEQYADLEEKHIQLLARHRRMQEGIDDVKKAAAKAGVRGAESKFINALATEISALKVEREKERRYMRDENRELKSQLQDTAEAVQAAGELLVRLKEAEEAVAAAQKRAMEAEQETKKAYQEIDNLKNEHQTEIQTVNRLLAESRLPNESCGAAADDFPVAKYDNGEPQNADDQQWKEEFKEFYGGEDGELSRLVEPKSWFMGYDSCNI
ncbi:hypothetical protein EUGRSUZ_L00643 [Eucalyptus grandis]|uniref:Kinesin motor domain-containing protein n=2 Tax=Eucalyptus grandis TaxID=71139 RepID=A0A058ZW66_EUCGR|nr:hypothetical protein EUGRSUZ_L00643 [Eucalyptus grandis]